MDMVTTIAAISGTGLLSVLVGVVSGRISKAPEVIYSPLPAPVEHEHQATSFSASGWWCDCGKHYHVFSFPIAGKDERTCVCGKAGIGKAWA